MKLSRKPAGVVLSLAIGCLLLAAPLVRAQDYETQMLENSTELYNNNISAITNGIINKSMLDKAIARNNARGSGRSTAATSAKATASRTSFAYVPTAALRQRTADAYVAKMRATNPAAATKVATGLAGKTNYTALYHEINEDSGLPENDAAAAMATYLLVNWMVVNNVRDAKTITPAKARAVQAQAASVLARNPKLSSLDAVAQLGEQLKLNATMLEVGWLRSVRDGTDAAYRQKIAAQLQSQFHLDMSKLQLTDRGLAKK